jgi:two-component system, LytTR family, response regulator
MSPKLKLAIIEDNSIDTIVLKHLIKVISSDIEICGHAETVEQAIALIEVQQPDIIFSDIELSNGTAFQVFEKLYEKNIPIGELVFMSGAQRFDYVVKAINFACLAFVSKPLVENDVRFALEKANARHTHRSQIETLLAHTQQKKQKIVIPVAQHVREIVDIESINYFEAKGQCTIVHFKDKTAITAFRILGHFKKLLTDDLDFFLIHQSFLVNVNEVKSFQIKTHTVKMKNSVLLEASRRHASIFKDYWDSFNKRMPPKEDSNGGA